MTENQIFAMSETGGESQLSPLGRAQHCKECGTAYRAARKASLFCSAQCRTDFTNRRFTRGALLYDLYMAHRFERNLASKFGVLAAMNRLASQWRAEDKARRGGRSSWGNWREYLLTHLNISSAVRMPLTRNGKDRG